MELTRRHALAGAAGVAATVLSAVPAAAAARSPTNRPSFYRYKVGDILVTAVSDGKNVFKLEDAFIGMRSVRTSTRSRRRSCTRHDDDLVRAARAQHRRQADRDRHRQRRAAKVNSKGANGLFADNFVAAGDPKAVDMVVISRPPTT